MKSTKLLLLGAIVALMNIAIYLALLTGACLVVRHFFFQ